MFRPAKSPKSSGSAGRGGPDKVLIVEDTAELAEVIVATLERIKIQAFAETHVDQALKVYYREHPDVILLDIGLPDKTGWKLLDAIKERDENDRPLVIVITAHGDPANRLMGKLQDVYGYLLKPFTPHEVEHIVTDALAHKDEPRARREVKFDEPLPDFIVKMMHDMEDSNDSVF